MEEQAGSPWGMIIGIVIGVSLGFLVFYGAWKMMPYVYNILFPGQHRSEETPVSNEDESAS